MNTPGAKITDRACAKINLTLEVLGKRADGYHEIASLVAFARDTADIVTLDLSAPAGLEISGPFAAEIDGPNLIDAVLRRLAETHVDMKVGRVTLTKNLPVAAGIGGGSADAAAVLRAIRRANPDVTQAIDWFGLARSFGADVPVCFHNRAAWMTGTGETLHDAPKLPELRAVLVNPRQPVPADKTRRVFEAVAAKALPASFVPSVAPGSVMSRSQIIEFMAERGNALEPAAARAMSSIADVKAQLVATEGCLYAALSGAGPTCFGLFEDADAAAAMIARRNPGWWVAASAIS